jgi:ADP-ribosylglycohydrolase
MKQSKEHLLHTIHGCLMGVACGDAMGMPSSMMSPDAVRKHFPKGITKFLKAPADHPIHATLEAGEITDDTQQTLVLADAILEDGKVDPHGIAHRLLAWAESLNGFDTLLLGPSSLRALRAIKEGKDIREAGPFGDTNGASMRIAPVGIINCGNVKKTVADVILACLPTHNTNIAISGASAVACAIGASIKKKQSIDSIINIALRGAALGMRFGNPWIGASIAKRTELALEIVSKKQSEKNMLRNLYDVIGAGVATTETIPVSLALFYYAKGDPIRTVQLTANLGGDADTLGAIAGAIAGAFAGIDAFPNYYKDTIERVNDLNLESYAERLANWIIDHGTND